MKIPFIHRRTFALIEACKGSFSLSAIVRQIFFLPGFIYCIFAEKLEREAAKAQLMGSQKAF
jgi:hypothetical protein